jgi:PAS domain S-box-containing protein
MVFRMNKKPAVAALVNRSPEHLADFLDTSAVGLHWVLPDGTIAWANSADYEPLGYTAEEYIGHNIAEFHADSETLDDILRRLASGERICDYEARLRCKDGSVRFVQISSSVLFDEKGKFVHTRCFTKDVTEHKRLLTELQSALAARDEFLAASSHQLKTPLTALQLQAHALRLTVEPTTNERALALVRSMERQVLRMALIIDEITEVSRIEAKGVALVPEEVDLAALARYVATTLDYEATEAKCAVVVKGEGPVTGRWDPVRLKLAVTHLVSNAIKYGAGKPIEVAVEAQGDAALLRVRDSGPGIAPEVAGTIFHKRFERDKGSRQSLGGLGLGLWLVHQIVKAHEGKVAAESRPGEGSTFTVELPRRL